jgi:hypothetical protein
MSSSNRTFATRPGKNYADLLVIDNPECVCVIQVPNVVVKGSTSAIFPFELGWLVTSRVLAAPPFSKEFDFVIVESVFHTHSTYGFMARFVDSVFTFF